MHNPAEANSVKELSVAREIYRARGVRLEEVAIAGSNEVLQAVQILAGRDIQAIWIPGDNTAVEGYEGAVKGAKDARLPLITDECSDLPRGGLACLGISLRSAGVASGKLAGQVLLGANPKDLPLRGSGGRGNRRQPRRTRRNWASSFPRSSRRTYVLNNLPWRSSHSNSGSRSKSR